MADKYELNDDELKNAAGGEIKIIISKEKVQKIKEMAKEKIREKISGTVLSDEELENASGGINLPNIDDLGMKKEVLEKPKDKKTMLLSDDELGNASGGALDSLEEKKNKLAELIQVEVATTLSDEVLKGSSSDEK